MGAHSETIGKEVYVWMNGSLLYKKWLSGAGGSVLFSKNPSQAIRKSDSQLSITDDNLTDYLLKKHGKKVNDPLLIKK